MERAIPIKLPPMREGARRTEEEMMAEFLPMRARILGALCDALSLALRHRRNTEPPRSLRMADQARWVAAGEAAINVPQGALVKAIEEAQHLFIVDRINDDALVTRLGPYRQRSRSRDTWSSCSQRSTSSAATTFQGQPLSSRTSSNVSAPRWPSPAYRSKTSEGTPRADVFELPANQK